VTREMIPLDIVGIIALKEMQKALKIPRMNSCTFVLHIRIHYHSSSDMKKRLRRRLWVKLMDGFQ